MRRYVPLAALEKAMQKYPFHLYGICLKANHIHLLLKPADATQLPERCISSPNMPQCCSTASAGVAGTFFWGGYYATLIASENYQRALNMLDYIQVNPKAEGVRKGLNVP
jgi:REP element-mobilizing transposase RayT